MSSKCTLAILLVLSCFLCTYSTPVPVGGISNVEFSIYPVGSPAHHQTLHSRPLSNKLKVNYDVKHPPNPNPVVPGARQGFRSQQNYYRPPVRQPQPEQRQNEWRRPEQQPEPQSQPQNWFIPDHVPQQERQRMEDAENGFRRQQPARTTHRPRPIFLDEVQQWEDPNISSHRRWNEERRAMLGGTRALDHSSNVQTNLMPALDESAPLEYF